MSPITSITRLEVQSLVSSDDAQLIEVLPREDYEQEHIRGAINIPLKELTTDTVAGLDRAVPLIVSLPDLVARMQERDVAEILVTMPGGELVGTMRRSDAEELLHELHAAHDHHHGHGP